MHCTRLSVHFASGRASSAATLSSIMEGKATWEMESAIINVGTQGTDGYEDMVARQDVVNNV